MLPYSNWLKLSISTRHKLAHIFKIPKTGATEVVSNEVVRDGYSIHDIEAAITKDALQYYLGSTQDNFMYLWEDTINKLEGNPAVERVTFTAATEEEPVTTVDEPTTVVGATPDDIVPIKTKNKGGRPRKHDKKD